MALLLAHTAILLLASYAAARRLLRAPLDQFLVTVLLGWANIVGTSLLLSYLHRLGDPVWFFRTSLSLAGLTWLALGRLQPEPKPATSGPLADLPSPRLLIFFCLTLLPLFYAGVRIAATYEPNNYDSLAYHLPRAMYYLGQNSLAHFDTGNPRQIYFPFNSNLLQLFCLVYGTPAQSVNFINLILWASTGAALYRLSRLATCSVNAALIATWLTLTATQILAQATTTTNDLPTGMALLSALLFALRWRQTRLIRDALLAGLAAGLAAGSKLTVIFFGPAAGLLMVYFAWQHWRAGRLRTFLSGARSWIAPGILAFALASPFALINLQEKGEWINKTYDFTLNRPFTIACAAQTAKAYLVQFFIEPLHRLTFDPQVTAQLNTWGEQFFFPHWNGAYAFSALFLFPPDLNEDHVWFGFTGPLILIAAVFCLLRCKKNHAPIAWLAWIGLGWFATYFLLNKWSLYNQRYFVLPILVLGPSLAAAFDAGRNRPHFRRLTGILTGLFTACSLWLAVLYLFKNTSRPYAPLWSSQRPPAALPALPPLIAQRISAQPWVNIESTDGNERIFLLMTLGKHQRFTSFDRTQPDAYNIFSEWGFPRKVVYSNIEQLSSYTMVAIASKRTAGVEFLGSFGTGVLVQDYYGLVPHPETKPADDGTRNALVTLYYGPRDPGRFAKLRIKVAGLNQPDQARLRVGVDYVDGTSDTLATFEDSGEAHASVIKPIRRFTVRVENQADRKEIGAIVIPYYARENITDDAAPQDPISLFSDELITRSLKSRVKVQGLATTEGPYPQWELPMFCWANAPIVRIEIPPQKNLERLDLDFELRLHIRDAAQFDLRFNGDLVAGYEWNTSTGWFIKHVSLKPKPGINVIEFRNVTVGNEPDWLDYLERHPDVKAYVESQRIPLAQGAREHYEAFGKKEKRPLYLKRQTTAVPGDQLYYLFRRLELNGFRSP